VGGRRGFHDGGETEAIVDIREEFETLVWC